ncbi:hypothetical protein [Flavobacterium bizetiae]|uniref:hypothetical protein n=1 Tax=Flavobacterium bizetiae TaxID=2704140 RepID=UPI0037574D5D
MKKLVVLLLVMGVSVQNLQAQAKWRKELLLQIAALQVYMDYAKKGYNVARKGLNFVGDLKKGELSLHGDYLASLKKVNLRIKKYSRVTEIVVLQVRIIKISNNTIRGLRQNDVFHGDEIDYIERAFERLFENCNSTLDELLLLTGNGNLEMKDDERLERIDALYKTMISDYEFSLTFSHQAKMLALWKSKQKNTIFWSRTLNGL